MEREQLTNPPARCGNPGSPSRGAIEGWLAPRRCYAQTLVRCAKVVDCPDQVHPVLQRAALASQGPIAARQRGQTPAEGGVEPFNVGGIDHASPARPAAANLFDLPGGASPNTALHADHPPLHGDIDHRRNREEFPRLQVRRSLRVNRSGVAERQNALQALGFMATNLNPISPDALLKIVEQVKEYNVEPPPKRQRGRPRTFSGLAFLLLAVVGVVLRT